ncbi:MAG: phosphoribosylglycinamide formyltransferase [Betaproteobacteria bacterium]|nr:phosphoribosylglycinamide formyltransferase [Betaproteobacteria bacterium]
MKSFVILISGRGSNMEAIVKAQLPIEIRAVITNRPDAKGLGFASTQGIATAVVDHKAFASRDAFDAALAETIDQYRPDYIVLAGFMRILTDQFIARYPHRIVNIHPSLLPAFPGLHTHRQALAAGVKLHGATVHFVTPRLDHGPIIVQTAVPVLQDDSEDALATRVLVQEHHMYPLAIKWLAEGRVKITPGDVVQLSGLDVSGQVSNAHLGFPCE